MFSFFCLDNLHFFLFCTLLLRHNSNFFMLNDLKKELFAKMQQDIVLELEKRKRDLQNMVEDMLAERREEMLEVLMNKVHRE